MIEDLLKPFSNSHSIKEAVISVFLANPIVKPERFQTLFDSGLSPDFHLFQNVGSLQIQVTQGPGVIAQPNTQNLGSIGFQFIGFDKGKISRTFQGINEPTRSYISYHSFSYTRWNEYVDEYIKYMKVLSAFQNDTFVKAVSIHYVDQFKWIADQPIELTKVFNNETLYAPKAFLESTGPMNFIYSAQKNDNGFVYNDRLEVKVNDRNSKDIFISHNLTKQLDDLKNLTLLLGDDQQYFNDLLLELHQYNKKVLGNILTQDVKNLIKLPIENQ